MFYIVGFCPEHRTHELAAGPHHEGWTATAKAWKLERAGWRSLLITSVEPTLARHAETPKRRE